MYYLSCNIPRHQISKLRGKIHCDTFDAIAASLDITKWAFQDYSSSNGFVFVLLNEII